MPSDTNKNAFQQLIDLKMEHALVFMQGAGRLALCPDMGGRIFAELAGISLHRIHLETVARPGNVFNNFGGGNFWPAPEGGKYAFNYRGDVWYVQPAINNQPFLVVNQKDTSAVIAKDITLINRREAVLDVIMQREMKLLSGIPSILPTRLVQDCMTYQTDDSFTVRNAVSAEEALIASWTLEQFDASPETISFAVVEQPRGAINFDFYDHPRQRIRYHANGFEYQTDGQKRGQIGINKSAGTRCVGFYDLSRRLLCMRENRRNPQEGIYFNMADNDQSNGPYSAADNYSIFNSDPDMNAFELETIGSAHVENHLLVGSKLTSVTTFAIFERAADLKDFIADVLGNPE